MYAEQHYRQKHEHNAAQSRIWLESPLFLLCAYRLQQDGSLDVDSHL